MKARFQLLVLGFILAVVFRLPAHADSLPVFTWATAPVNGLLTNSLNWVEATAPSEGAQLVFGASNRSIVDLDASFDVDSITFSAGHPSYIFRSSFYEYVGLGAGGITVAPSSSSSIRFESRVSFELKASQTWQIDGTLAVLGSIFDYTPTTLTKTGAGTLILGSTNSFTGGMNVEQGTLVLAEDSHTGDGYIFGPVGQGDLHLASGTTLASAGYGGYLHNNVTLGSDAANNTVTLDSSGEDGLAFAGDVTLGAAETTIQLTGPHTVEFSGTLAGPASTQLIFQSPAGANGSAAFFGDLTASLQSITADNASLFFLVMPASGTTLAAVNRGYIGAVAGDPEEQPIISAAALLARIPNQAGFDGTFGIDFDPDSEIPYVHTDALDFSNFTHPNFRIGSHTLGIAAGPITPVNLGATSLYPFGGGSGHLVVASDLTDAPGAPASVLVSSAIGADAQYVLFRGNNTYTGTTTLNGIAAQLAVERSIAVLDSSRALPGSSSTFTFGAGAHAYIGATEAAFPLFNSFLARLAPGGHNALSILGIDSHDFFESTLEFGEDAFYFPREVNEAIDLRSFSSIFLGSASHARLNGLLYAPADGVLRLTGVDDGHLTIAGPLAGNVQSVELGSAAGGPEEFGDGTVEMSGTQTYSGNTTLRSGTLAIGGNSHVDHTTHTLTAGPIGTGTLTVAPGISRAILTAIDGYREFYNSIVLNAPLQLGDRRDFREDLISIDSDSGTDANLLHLYSDISGSGSLHIHGPTHLSGNNTYTGGTEIVSALVLFGNANAFGNGMITFRSDTSTPTLLSALQPLTLTNAISLSGSLQFSNTYEGLKLTGPVSLAGHTTLFSSFGRTTISGPISGMYGLNFEGYGSSGSIWLGDAVTNPTNTYEGGTEAWSGITVFANPSAIPAIGQLQSSSNGYIGAAFASNPQTSFLDRFNKEASSGTVGFDSADPSQPTVIAGNLDFTDFSSSVRLGSSTIAIITGTITPASSEAYRFGNGGGELIVTSNLGGNRGIDVLSYDYQSSLTLVLKGDNSATNGLHVERSVVRLDAANALPASGLLTAEDFGYIGYTENVAGLTPTLFLGRFGVVGEDAIIGFDSANPQSWRTIGDAIDLTAYPSNFRSDTYIGTSTAINLNGALTGVGGVLNLTGVNQGRLMVNSAITPANATHVVIGTPLKEISGSGSVTLNAANSYTGGTTLNYSHLILGHASALGTGALTNAASWSGLSVNQPGLTIANAINTGTVGNELNLNGPNNFTLSGTITGSGSLSKSGTSTITLAGANSAFSGDLTLSEGTLVFSQDTSAGTGEFLFSSLNGATAQFLSAAPSIGALSGHHQGDRILLANDSVLTINQDSFYGYGYHGTITGSGASVVFQNPHTSSFQTHISLHGANTYTGGTTIKNNVTVIAANSAALGTVGNVTIAGGTLATAPGVTLTFHATPAHQLVFQSGRIAGHGNITLENNLIIGAQQGLAPGLDSIGKLSLGFSPGATLILASGGTYEWKLADASASASGTGWDFIQVAGTVDIAASATAGATFDLKLRTFSGSGFSGYAANFDPSTSMSWAILTASNITNFDPTKFNIDITAFFNPLHDGTFSLSLVQNLSANTSTLFLNFTPVPEPSTWALLLSGVAVVVFTALRRRK